MDAITLRIFWNQLIAIANEQARALRRIAFSPVVREAGDLAVAICDTCGRMLANADTGAPGHINSMANAGRTFLDTFKLEDLQPGDVLVTNDPWLAAGHLFDITMMTPVFHRGRVIAFVGSCIHHSDIGGYGMGAGARDIHEEGLWIPPVKLYEAGKPNETLYALLRRNVREPEQLVGDLAAQVSCGRIGCDRLVALCERYGLDDLEDAGGEIIARSEQATRDAIRKLAPGVYHGETTFDVPGGEAITLKAAVHIDAKEGEVLVDFAGSSGPSPIGINVVANYSHAYVCFAIRCCLNPDLPNNYGSLMPIKLAAPPDQSILNAKYPSPVSARHVVGMYIPMPIMKALYAVLPDAVIAECAGGLWTAQIGGRDADGRTFTSSMFSYSGGMGARATKPGLAATCYPSGIAAVPIEVLESVTPILFDRKEQLEGTGGRGKYAGGDGQIIQFRMRTRDEWTLNTIVSRTRFPSEGVGGGGAGTPGRFLINGEPVASARKLVMQPTDVVTFETPGGGAYGAPDAPAIPTDVEAA
jgi:N-methylhydantoinase B